MYKCSFITSLLSFTMQVMLVESGNILQNLAVFLGFAAVPLL